MNNEWNKIFQASETISKAFPCQGNAIKVLSFLGNLLSFSGGENLNIHLVSLRFQGQENTNNCFFIFTFLWPKNFSEIYQILGIFGIKYINLLTFSCAGKHKKAQIFWFSMSQK
jgi:hypothetical protein